MNLAPQHISGTTVHSRLGSVSHAFRYGVDYMLIDPQSAEHPALFSRNRFNLTAIHDRHHGGKRGEGKGVAWAQKVFAEHGLPDGCTILLLAQPSYLGYWFNPVSFWLAMEGDDLRAVIAEVSNTFGDRHSYLCHLPDFAPIGPTDTITAQKCFHVSPFQTIAGDYEFVFNIRPGQIAIRILHRNGNEGVIATLTGARKPLGNRAILTMSLRRPLGALRTVALIYWQALRLKLKGARYTPRPAPPTKEVT